MCFWAGDLEWGSREWIGCFCLTGIALAPKSLMPSMGTGPGRCQAGAHDPAFSSGPALPFQAWSSLLALAKTKDLTERLMGRVLGAQGRVAGYKSLIVSRLF